MFGTWEELREMAFLSLKDYVAEKQELSDLVECFVCSETLSTLFSNAPKSYHSSSFNIPERWIKEISWKELYPDLHIRTAVCLFTFTLSTCYSLPLLSAIDKVFVYTVFQTNSETRTASNNFNPVLVSEQLGEESLHQDVGWARVAPERRPQHLRQAGDSRLIFGKCLSSVWDDACQGRAQANGHQNLGEIMWRMRRKSTNFLKFLCLAKEMSMSPFFSTPNPLIFADLI